MSTQTLKKCSLLKLSMGQIAKCESWEKGVISRELVSLILSSENIGIQLFKQNLIEMKGHPCQLKTYRTWSGNMRIDKSGRQLLNKPRTFSKRFQCKCVCDRKGELCECTCDSIVKMLIEYKDANTKTFMTKPTSMFQKDTKMGCRINPHQTVEDVLY